LNQNITTQREKASQYLSIWKEYESEIEKLKPWVEKSESQAASFISKPTTISQAIEMLDITRTFEQQCTKHLPRLENLIQISQQLGSRTSAPDEVDTVHSRWNSVHDTAVQTKTKLDKLISCWNTFENDTNEFNDWLGTAEKAVLIEPNLQSSDINKLEQELTHLKNLNKEISNRQIQLITLTQISDQISHGLSMDGATALKGRVVEIKTRVNKLADTVRHQINNTSDAVLARNEFQIKISDFENWMSRLRQNTAEISDVHIDNVDFNLQAVHAYLQEHSEKQPNFTAIYEEVKSLSTDGSPEEAANLDQIYTSLAAKYKALEDDLRQKKNGLEKWTELLNWNHEAIAQLNHYKYEAEARKPTIDDCERLSGELKNVQAKINIWKEEIPIIDCALGIQVRDKQEKPLTASLLINNLETQVVSLENTLSAKRDKLENLSTKWDNFRQLQQKLTEDIIVTQTALQEVTYNVDTCEKLKPAIEKISNLIEEHQKLISAKESLHEEGAELLKEDQRSMTNVQVVLSSVDSNWEKVNELLQEQRIKYTEMEAGL
jgi:nesprin-1